MPAAVIVGAFVASGAAAAVGAAVAGAIGIGAVSTLTATAIGAGIAQGTMTAVSGGSASDVLKSAVIGGALSYAGGAIGEAVFGQSSVNASDAVNRAIQSGVSDTMINQAMTTTDPLAALNAAAGWTTSDPSYLQSIGYAGLLRDPITNQWTDVDTAAKAQSAGWQNATDTGVSNASYVDKGGTYFNADGQAVAFTQPDGSVLQAGQTAQPVTASTSASGNLPVQGAVRVDAGGTYFDAQNQAIGFTQGDGSIVAPGGQQLVAPTQAVAPTPVAPPTTTPLIEGNRFIVAGTEMGQQIPGAYSVDAQGIFYNVNGDVVAHATANGGVVDNFGTNLIEAPAPAPAPVPTEVATAPTPAPVPTEVATAPTPVAPTVPMPNLPANIDQASVQNFLNQGYTPQQIQAAVDANPNGGWGRSLMWGEQGAPGAVPPSVATVPTAVTPTAVAKIDPNWIPVSGPTIPNAAYMDVSGTFYDAAGTPVATTQANGSVLEIGTNAQLSPPTPAGPGTQVASAETPFRVDVSGVAHTVEAPPPANTVLPENTQLATQAQVDSGAATWDPTSSSWVTPTAPVELSPVVPVEVPPSEPIPTVTVSGVPTYAPAVPVETAPATPTGGSNIVAGAPAETPLTVGGQILTPDQYAGAADRLTVGTQPVSPTQVAGSTAGGAVSGAIPVSGPAPVAPAPVAPETSVTGAPPISTTPNTNGSVTTTYADGSTVTSPPAGTTNPVASVTTPGTVNVPGTTAGTGAGTTGATVGSALGTGVAGPVAPAPAPAPTTATKIPTTPTTTTGAPTQTSAPPGVNNNGSPAVTTTNNADGTNTTTYADGSKVNWGTVGAAAGAALATTMVNQPNTGTGGYNYTYNPAAPLDIFKQPLATSGLNPGFINPTPMYQTTSPVQSQYYWGAHPYQTGPGFNAQLYNTVPAAPAVPWGLQQPPGPFDVNTFIAQNITPQAQAAAAGTAPQYYAPMAPATAYTGGIV